jgi:hypothetical protein
VENPYKQLVYEWINAREEKGENISTQVRLEKYFPEGPTGEAKGQVDLVVVTPDSA